MSTKTTTIEVHDAEALSLDALFERFADACRSAVLAQRPHGEGFALGAKTALRVIIGAVGGPEAVAEALRIDDKIRKSHTA